MAGSITEEFLNRAARVFGDALNTCKEALKFGEKQSVIGARLNASSQDSYRKSEKALQSGNANMEDLLDQSLGLKAGEKAADLPTHQKK